MEITEADVGKLVAYYDEGWRYGYIDEFKPRKKIIKVKPIGAKGANPHAITVNSDDIKEPYERVDRDISTRCETGRVASKRVLRKRKL